MAQNTAQQPWQGEVRAFRLMMQGLQNPIGDFLLPFDRVEREIAKLEVELPVLDVAPFGPLPIPSGAASEEPTGAQAMRRRQQMPAGQLPDLPTAASLPDRPRSSSTRRSAKLATPGMDAIEHSAQPAPVFPVRPHRPKATAAVAAASTAPPSKRPAAVIENMPQPDSALSRLAEELSTPPQTQPVNQPSDSSAQTARARSFMPLADTFSRSEPAASRPVDELASPAVYPALALIETLTKDLLGAAAQSSKPIRATEAVSPSAREGEIASTTGVELANSAERGARPIAAQMRTDATGLANRSSAPAQRPGGENEFLPPDPPPTSLPDARTFALLINEVLAEEAARHGVDLS